MLRGLVTGVGVLIGAGLIGLVVFLGFRANDNPDEFYIWFAVAAPILPSIGLAVISFALTDSYRTAITKITRIEKIEALIDEANTREEQVAVLEQQRDQMEAAVRTEAHRQTLVATKTGLESQGVRVLQDLQRLDSELEELDVEVANSAAAEQVHQLRDRLEARRRGDLIFRLGNRQFRLSSGMFSIFPFGLGSILWSGLILIDQASKRSKGPK